MHTTDSRTKNTMRNIIFGTFNKVIVILLPFIIRTIIIFKMGEKYVGVGSLFTSVLQVLSVTELGFASAVTFALYGPISRGEDDKIISLISLLKTVYRTIGLIILIMGLIVMPFIPFMIKGDVPADINVFILYGIYLSNTVISYLTYGYKSSILNAFQRNDLVSKINTIIEILKGGIQIVVLLLIGNYYIYIVMLPGFTFISNVAINILTNRLYPKYKVNMRMSFKGIANIKTQIGGIAIGRLSLVCRNSLDSIIISSIIGLTATAIYSNYYLIFSSITSMLGIILTAMAASVGNSIVTEGIEKNERDHVKFDFYFMILVGICTVCLFSLYQPFMKAWVGEDLLLPRHTMILFCLYFYSNSLAQVRSVYSEGAGLWWNFKWLAILEMLANLVLNIGLGILWGIDGIIIATIITSFACSFIGITIKTYHLLFFKKATRYYLYNALYASLTLIACVILFFIYKAIHIDGIYLIIIRGILSVAVVGLIYSTVYFIYKPTRIFILDLLNKILKRKKAVGYMNDEGNKESTIADIK